MAPSSTGSPASGGMDGKGSEGGSDEMESDLELDSDLLSLGGLINDQILDDLLLGVDEDAFAPAEDIHLPSIQHEPAVDPEFFSEQHTHQDPTALESGDAGPEVHWLANHIINRSSAARGQVQIEEIIERIMTNLIPRIRQQGHTGTTAEELIGAFNARLRGEIPLAPCASEPSKSGPARFEGSDWKRKNRPTGLTYNKRSKKKPKSLDVSRALHSSLLRLDKYSYSTSILHCTQEKVTKLAKHKKDEDDGGGGDGGTGISIGMKAK